MACDLLNPASCLIDGATAGVDAVGDAAAAAVGNQFAEAMAGGASWVLRTTIGWWVNVPAIDLQTSPAATIRSYVLWLSLAVATVGMMWQGIMLVLSRRPDPLLGIGRGLFTVALWGAVGIIGPAAALRAGDAFSAWVLNEASSGQAAERLTGLADMAGVTSPGAIILLGLLLMFSGLAQAGMMIFREGAVVVLAGVVVLAAAGSFTNATRPWLHKVVGWMLALIAYKPIAALVYATAIAMVGTGHDPRTVLVGLTMIILAIFALPALMKFFTWTTGTAASGGMAVGAGLVGASASALQIAGASRSASGASAAEQAAHIRQDLGPAAASAPLGAASAAPALAASGLGGPAIGSAAPTGATAGSSAAGAASSAAAGPVGVGLAAAQLGASAAQRASAAAQEHLTEGHDW
jgi:hypothetical protein